MGAFNRLNDMWMRVLGLLVFAGCLAGACRREQAAPQPSKVRLSVPLSSVVTTPSPTPTSMPTGTPTPQPVDSLVEEDDDEACAPAAKVDPAVLTATWPRRLGQRLRFTARVERALDFTDYIVTAKGHRFVVMMAPDQSWEGSAERTFSVLGSTTAALRGRVTLPHLVLEDPESCPP